MGAKGRRAVTLRAIARAADTPVASIYHYFPDVDSVIAAVAAEYGDDLSAVVEAATSEPMDSIDELLDVVVATYRGYFAARPGLRELWFDRRATEKVVAIHRDFRAKLAEMLRKRMGAFTTAPHDPLTYAMLFEMVGVLWELAFELDDAGDPRVITEVGALAGRFLHRRFGIAAPGPVPLPAEQPDVRDVEAVVLPGWRPEQPPQERGRKRRAEILAAASSLIDAEGPHGVNVTIRGITDAAGASPASVYRYFNDLDSLVATVAYEFMNELLSVGEEAVRAAPHDWDTLVAHSVSAHREFFARHPGLRRLWFDRRASETLQEMHTYYRRVAAARQRDAVARFVEPAGDLFDHELHVEITGALWEFAFTADPAGHPDAIAEIDELGREVAHRVRERSR